ncbi:MAG: hypothetical protein PUA75_12025 [Clostridiales bacterium]|nr:hypothetical protein [Clostridiales bacterium]
MSETENQVKKEERVSIKDRRKKSLGTTLGTAVGENRSMLILFGVIVAVLLVILVSIITLKMPVVPICVIVLIEAALAACLHDVPIWLHGLVVIAQIVAGVLCGVTVFMILCALVYIAGILSLRFIR